MLNISLDQIQALQAVVEAGGFARAAEQLNRSQSSVSYQVSKLQQQTGLSLLRIEGRRAVLTEQGEVVLKQAQQLLHEKQRLAELVESLKQDWEPVIRLVVDTAFPSRLLMQALQVFMPASRGSRVQLTEAVLSGASDALQSGEADLAICVKPPPGFLGEEIIQLKFVAVAHPAHALHQLKRELTTADLERELQVVIHDSGVKHKMDIGWLGAEHQWSVSKMETAVAAISHGLGFGWLPEYMIKDETVNSLLKPLPLREGANFTGCLQLVFGKPDYPGPASKQLAACIRNTVQAGVY